MTYFYSALVISVFAITLNVLNAIVNELYAEDTKNILLTLVSVILILIAAASFFSAKNKKMLSWRLIWLAASIVCLTSGWLNLPSVHKQHLLKKAVETGIQIDGVRREYPSPSSKEESVWILENELKAKIADLRWGYWNKIQKIAPDRENNYGLSVVYFMVGILCLLSSIFAGLVIRNIG